MTGPGAGEREWNADAYRRVASPMFAWGMAVLEGVTLQGNETVADVGCGDGWLTLELAARIPRGRLIACDRSANMTTLARQALADVRYASVVQADAVALPFSEAFDAVFSAATFHWVTDHGALFQSIYGALRPGGVLVAQCGGLGNLARVLAHADLIAEEASFAPFFAGWRRPFLFARADESARRLQEAGFVDVATSVTPSPTPFENQERCIDFLNTVVLRLYVQRLPDARLRSGFLQAVASRCARDTPPLTLDYQRLNIRARRR